MISMGNYHFESNSQLNQLMLTTPSQKKIFINLKPILFGTKTSLTNYTLFKLLIQKKRLQELYLEAFFWSFSFGLFFIFHFGTHLLDIQNLRDLRLLKLFESRQFHIDFGHQFHLDFEGLIRRSIIAIAYDRTQMC